MGKEISSTVLLISDSETFLTAGLKKQLEEKGGSTLWVKSTIEEVSKIKTVIDAAVLF